MTRIKICGITTMEDACRAADAGADAIGLNFYPQSPRYIDPRTAMDVVSALPAFTSPVGVFVGTPMRQVCAIAYQLGLRGVQTYEDTPPSESTFPFAHIAAFRVKESADLDLILRFVDGAMSLGRRPAAVLIDSRVEGLIGGTGRTAPWELLKGFDPGVPVILAGGLTADNVGEAIRTVRPWGIDVASGVEAAPGRKDPSKMLRFVKIAQEAGSVYESD